jgi:hypothetical protein
MKMSEAKKNVFRSRKRKNKTSQKIRVPFYRLESGQSVEGSSPVFPTSLTPTHNHPSQLILSIFSIGREV